MTPAAQGEKPRVHERIVGWAVTAAIACMPLVFVHITGLGGFDLTLPYAMTILLGAILLAHMTRAGVAAAQLLRSVAPWLMLYVLYLLVLAMHLAGFPDNGIILRQAFFLICGLTIGAALVLSRGDARILRRSGVLALLGFLLVTEVIAWSLGMSWMIAIERFVVQGDWAFLVYQFFRAIFQVFSADGGEVPAAVKNIVSSGVFVVLVLMRAGYTGARPDRWGQALTIMCIAILVMLNTRAVLLVVLLALPLAAAIGATRRPRHSMHGLILKALVVFTGLVALVLVISMDGATTSTLEDRFTFGDASAQGRLEQIEFALSGIERSVLVGSGLAEINGQLVHNLFLGAWLHGGLISFLLAAAAYGLMVGFWARFVVGLMIGKTWWVLPARPEWIAVLPLLAFFRVWVAGDAGHPGFAEWVSLCAFFALLSINARIQATRSSAARPMPHAAMVTG